MPAHIAHIEDALLDRLRQALTRAGQAHPVVDVRAWPGRPSEYRMVHAIGAALVVYQGASFSGDGKGLSPWVADFEVALFARNLRSHQPNAESPDSGTGAYDLLAAIRAALQGWQLPQATGPLMLKREAFSGHTEGVWAYSLRLSVPLLAVLDVPDVAGPWTDAVCADAPALAGVALQHPAEFFPLD